MAFWTTFLALALGPLVQFQKKFLGTIYQIWWGIGPIFSLLGPKMWEELRWKGIKWLLLYKGRDVSFSPFLLEKVFFSIIAMSSRKSRELKQNPHILNLQEIPVTSVAVKTT